LIMCDLFSLCIKLKYCSYDREAMDSPLDFSWVCVAHILAICITRQGHTL
jgi:hypothetical protein